MATSVEVLRRILERYEDFDGRFAVPGEGGERAFRTWLVIDLLHHHFKWPSRFILVGERHDVILLNDQLFPIITIETKEPRRVASAAEKAKFAERLAHYTTLRLAFLTDGYKWLKVSLAAPAGLQEVTGRTEFGFDRNDTHQFEAFLACLNSQNYILESHE